MLKDPDKHFVTVNQILGKPASIGPIPASQILPWIIIIIISYAITNGFFSFGIPWFLGVSFWLIVSWWLVTGNQPHKILDTFRNPPGGKRGDWCNGNLLYISPIAEKRPPHLRKKVKDSQIKIKLKPVKRRDQEGKKRTYMPFQNDLDLIAIVSIEKEQRTVSGYLLNKGSQYQVVFGFYTQGLHNILYRSEITNTITALEEGLKDIPAGEKLTIHNHCYSSDLAYQQQLSKIADNCSLTPISILVRNQQQRIQELTVNGTRQNWQQILFCTWTYNETSGSKSQGWLSKLIIGITNAWKQGFDWFTGNERLYREEFFKKLLLKAFEEGFINWEILLNTKIGLEIESCTSDQLWDYIWYKFNHESVPPPPLPQLMVLAETDTGIELSEIRNDPQQENKDIKTILIEGQNGISATPQHEGDTKTVRLPGKKTKCAVAVMATPPQGWVSQREQLRSLWKILSKSYVRDTEVVVEISRASDFLIKDNLSRQSKQSRSARERAFKKGQGRDVGAEVKQEQSFDAQKKLYKGAKSLHAATTFVVYRPTEEQLRTACMTLANSFSTAKILREDNIAWATWLETLPITISWLLHSSSLLDERRQTYDTESIAGVLPLTIVRDLDRKGIEFISQGGKPVYVDIIHNQISRALLTGESGSGKSAVGWQFMLDALSHNISVVGMDTTPGSGSTFKAGVQLLGDDGAYYEISSSCSSNLMEIPDLRSFSKEEQGERMETWSEFIRESLTIISMGKVHDPRLAQRVDNLILKTLDIFLKDPDIVERYNRALQMGWKSAAWQNIPLLEDLLNFCTKEQLNIQNFEPIDKAAINQIQSQIKALLVSPLGKSLGKPSTFSPNPAIKFFGLSQMSNDQDQYLMALNVYGACIRTALSNPKTLFVGDELPILFKKDGFADRIGELMAIGRKNGIAVLLLGQDIDSFCQCSAGDQILQNAVYRITGTVTNSGANSWIKHFDYPPEIITQNAGESFRPRKTEIYSNWLIEKQRRFWQCRYYPAYMTLAAIANNPDEAAARARVMTQYPSTMRGKMLGLRDFADQYIQATRQGESLETIGITSERYNDDSHSSGESIKAIAL